MARKNFNDYEVSTNQSLATSFISPVTIISYMDNVGYQINITTSNSTGSFAVQVSNDYDSNELGTNVYNPGTWASLDLGGTPVAAGANDIISISLNQLPYKAIRINYTSNVAGTGTCDIYLSSKQVGG